MKKYILVSLVIAFLIVTLGSACMAGVANTSKKGSLLIFPLIRTDNDTATDEQWETLMTIANDSPTDVMMQCVFVLKDGCENLQYDFPLTGSQPLIFRASDGKNLEGYGVLGGGIGTGQVAEAKCWAKQVIDEDGGDNTTQISFNHLSGEATLLRTVGGTGVGAAAYPAWRFAANGVPLGQEVGTPGTLLLTGTTGNYDSCPAMLHFDLLRQTADPAADAYTASVDNFIALAPCKQDVSQDGSATQLKTRIIRYDENERSSSGQFCLNCFLAESASQSSSFPNVVDTPAGLFKVEPFSEVGGPCSLPSPQQDTYPVVGVVVKRYIGFGGPIAASTPTGYGEWASSPGAPNYRGTPMIVWDPY